MCAIDVSFSDELNWPITCAWKRRVLPMSSVLGNEMVAILHVQRKSGMSEKNATCCPTSCEAQLDTVGSL